MRNILHNLSRDECEQLALALERMVRGVSAYAAQLDATGSDPLIVEAMEAKEQL